jgi:hypothetical protein
LKAPQGARIPAVVGLVTNKLTGHNHFIENRIASIAFGPIVLLIGHNHFIEKIGLLPFLKYYQ